MSFAAYIYAILPFRVNGIANFHLDANENNYSVSLSEEGSDFLSNYSESLMTTQEDD